MRERFLAFFGLAVLCATPALADGNGICIRRDEVREWASPASRSLIIQSDAQHKAMLQLTSGCSGFGVYDKLAIGGPAETGNSCVSAGDTVATTYAGEAGQCRIVSVTPYEGPLPPRVSHP